MADIDNMAGRILIAEDDVINRRVLARQMNLFGLKADIVEDGQEAWSKWQTGNYALLLTDIHMPNLDGIQLVRKIRQQEKRDNTYTPIIAITANSMEIEGEECLKAGMDAFLTKPVTLQKLQKTLEYWLPRQKPGIRPPGKISSETTTSESPIDISMLVQLVGDNPDSHFILLKSFLNFAPEIICDIEDAAKDNNLKAVEQLAHKLKSSAKSMGANKLTYICQALEEGGGNSAINEVQALIPELSACFEDVRSFVLNSCDPENEKKNTGNKFPRDFHDLRVLLVDDDRLMLDVTTLVLNELGITDIITSQSAQQGLTYIETIQCPFDVIFCDIHMPGMDGVEFLRHLSEQGYAGAIILLSGADSKIINSVENLADVHNLNTLCALRKPAMPAEIATALKQINMVGGEDASMQIVQVTAEDLLRGISNNEFVTYYQPQVDIKSGRVLGMEALVRWQHPEKGLIPPNNFIHVAEQHDIIDKLTKIVFEQAMKHTAHMKSEGYDLDISINLSACSLNDLGWPEFFIRQAERAGVDPSKITLEITESCLMENLAAALEILTRLSMNNIKLSIDDFGTGYSSLEQLQKIPFSELKIDKYFVNKALHDSSARTILESSVKLARNLNLVIVAEGVETQEEWDLIQSLGCDRIQGYLVTKPLLANEFTLWIKQWKDKTYINI